MNPVNKFVIRTRLYDQAHAHTENATRANAANDCENKLVNWRLCRIVKREIALSQFTLHVASGFKDEEEPS